MIVLGINDGHNASAALLVDGAVVAALNEERLTRRKNEYGYPAQAIVHCLKIAGVSANQIDHVALATKALPPKYFLIRRNSSFTIADYWKEQREYWYPKLYQNYFCLKDPASITNHGLRDLIDKFADPSQTLHPVLAQSPQINFWQKFQWN